MGLEDIAARIGPIIAIMIIGAILRRHGFREKNAEQLGSIVLFVTLPALIFISLASAPLNPSSIEFPMIAVIFCALMLCSGIAISRIFGHVPKAFPISFATFEGGMFGYAFFTALFGAGNLWKLLIFDIGNGLFFFTVIYCMLKRGEGKGPGSILALFRTPIMLSILAALAIAFSGLWPAFSSSTYGSLAEQTMKTLGSATVPLIALSIGMRFSLKMDTLPLKLVLARIAVTVPAGLVFMFLTMRLLSVDLSSAFPILFMAMLPISFSLTILMGKGNKEKEFLVNSTLISIPFSVLLIVIAAALVGV